MSDTASTRSKDRSVSRGRDSFQSSGRGGAGNIRRSSLSRDPAASPAPAGRDPDLYSPARGREPGVDREKPTQTHAVGRGGVGNIRSRSRARATSKAPEGHPQTASIISEAAANEAEYERNVIKAAQEAANAKGSGRGGMGNITKSRSRSRGPAVHSTGRGGRGNIQSGSPLDAEESEALDEVDRLRFSTDAGIHSTGRGGIANITSMNSPTMEAAPIYSSEFETSGRGGAGNIRSRSASRDPNGRSGSKDPHGIAKIWNKVTRSQSRKPSEFEDRGRPKVPSGAVNGEGTVQE
ncbi:hypothetical protein C8Q75DRAFT_711651 [Abortiporus biennis]|nr:hypothetical protein C8Q75DRAFT_711651 [Abortiporus biennis]